MVFLAGVDGGEFFAFQGEEFFGGEFGGLGWGDEF